MERPYFIIQPDFGGCIGNYSKDNCSYFCDDDIIELEGYEHNPFHIPGIERWCTEWEIMNDCHIHNKPCSIDEDEWYRRGQTLAQLFRQILPSQIDLYYLKHEEKALIDRVDYFVFSPDCNYTIGTTNLYSISYDENIIEIADFAPFEVPGLHEWYEDFDSNVEYLEEYADPEFDWATWYFKGIEMVKTIRQNLPASVIVWYRIPYELRNVFPVKDLKVLPDCTFKIMDFSKDTRY